jgi:hypothetical protein
MSTQNIFDLTDLWNNAGTTFVGIKLNATDTASAAGSLLMDLQVGGSSKFGVLKDGSLNFSGSTNFNISGTPYLRLVTNELRIVAASAYSWSSTGLASGASDLSLARDAADTLAQRRGTNAQAFRLYNTFTDASNYERCNLGWIGNEFYVNTAGAGTGNNSRQIVIQAGGAIRIVPGNINAWSFNTSGHFLAGTDNTYDIGASGANRPRAIYTAGLLSVGGLINQKGRFAIDSPTDGVAVFYNNANTGFSRLQFGGTTSSFPALKRDTTSLQARLADDSAFTNIQGKITTETAYTAGAPTATGYLVLYDSNGTAYKIPAEAL